MNSVDADIAKAQVILNPPTGLKGSVLGDIIKQISEWIGSLEFASYGKEAMHKLLHYIYETLIPAIKNSAPDAADLILDSIVIPFLKKLDEVYFHTT